MFVTNSFVTIIYDLRFTQTEALALGRGSSKLKFYNHYRFFIVPFFIWLKVLQQYAINLIINLSPHKLENQHRKLFFKSHT